jgi:gliding motility-associated-like protein
MRKALPLLPHDLGKLVLMLGWLLFTGTTNLFAQAPFYVGNVTVTLTGVVANTNCGNDQGGFLFQDPDPRMNLSVNYAGNPAPATVTSIVQDDVPCPNWDIADQVVFSSNNFCGTTINLSFVAWEEDCGNNNGFDNCCNPIFGICTGEDDSFLSSQTFTIDFQNTLPFTPTSYTFTQGPWGVTVSVVWEPADVVGVTGVTTICANQTTTLTAAHLPLSPSTGQFNWYTVVGQPPVFQGAVFTTPPLVSSTTYFVTEVFGNCESVSEIVTVNVLPAPAAPTTSNVTICNGGTATLTATPAGGGTLEWFSDAAGTVLVGTGPTFTTPVLAASTTYYVSENSGTCSGALAPIVVTVGTPPPTPVVPDVEFCENTTIEITAFGNPTIQWYNQPNGGSVIATGNLFNPGALAPGAYNYYASSYDGQCESNRDPVTLIVYAQPAAPTVAVDSVCPGVPATLTATGAGINFNWYGVAAGGAPLLTGSVFNTPVINAPTTYWVSTLSAQGCESPRTQVDLNLYVVPQPTANNATTCPGGTASLSANAPGSTAINWYSSADGTGLLATGASFTTPVLAVNTTYFVAALYPNGCESAPLPVNVVVNPASLAPAAADVVACENENIVLEAIGNGGVLSWWDSPTATIALATGTPTFNVGTLAAGTYVYFVSELNGSCESSRTDIVVVVNPQPSAPTASNLAVCAGETATLTAAGVGDLYWFDATQTLLAAGNTYTTATAGTYTVVAELRGCESPGTDVVLTVNALPVIGTVTNNGPLCEGDTLLLDAPTRFGTAYAWEGPNGWTSNVEDPQLANVSELDNQGIYLLQVTDLATGCVSLPVATLVEVNSVPSGGIALNNGPACEGSDATLTTIQVFGGSYAWSGPNGFSSNDREATIPAVTEANEGAYTVTISVGNCSALPATTTLVVNPVPVVEAGDDQTIEVGDPVTLAATGASTYTWSPSDNLNNPALATPIFAATATGTYTLLVTGTTDGCSSSDSVTVTVNERTSIEVADLFTPNGDGVNDTWQVNFLQYVGNYTLSVYSRGGATVFTSSNYNSDWNGTNDGSNLPDGTYWYVIETEGRTYKGAVTIKR